MRPERFPGWISNPGRVPASKLNFSPGKKTRVAQPVAEPWSHLQGSTMRLGIRAARPDPILSTRSRKFWARSRSPTRMLSRYRRFYSPGFFSSAIMSPARARRVSARVFEARSGIFSLILFFSFSFFQPKSSRKIRKFWIHFSALNLKKPRDGRDPGARNPDLWCWPLDETHLLHT